MVDHPKKEIDLHTVITALLDMSKPFSPTYLHRFSDLNPGEVRELKTVWEQVNPDRRVALLQDLEVLAEADTLVNFDDIARFALQDPDPRARAVAISLLSQVEDHKLISPFIHLLQKDPDAEVRAEAAAALGTFVFLGALEKISAEEQERIKACLLVTIASSDAPAVRRAALESFSYSGDEEITGWIKKAYQRPEWEWRASALNSMGRSADPAWEGIVLKHLDDATVELQFEAVRAAGNLELDAARQPLIDLLIDDPQELDEDVRLAAIWSLSQIGGDGVAQLLERLLENAAEDDETSLIEEAIENLELTDGLEVFDILDVVSPAKEDLDTIIDLSEEQLENDDIENDDEKEGKPKRKKR